LSALPVLVTAATLTWLLSLPMRNVGIVDSTWALMLFAAGVIYGLGADPRAPRLAFVLWLLVVWTARHAIRSTASAMRNGEHPRYQAMRARHGPGFAWKSLFFVFWFQALLAWVVSLPLLGVFASNRALGLLDYLGIGVWLGGFLFDVFRERLRGHTRLPNYAGELGIWWGFWLIALAAGAWWSAAGPALLTYRMWRDEAANAGRGMPTTS
jgi:steroid 5-alpha reductase family enzyme